MNNQHSNYSKNQIESIVDKILVENSCKTYPINPLIVANKLTLKVNESTFTKDNISGVINFKTKDIYVSRYDVTTRKRFSIAHEIGHFILHRDIFENKNQHITYRDNVSSLGFDINEIEANFFAATLLMPRDEMEIRWKYSKNINYIAEYFWVSVLAAGFRLEYLGLINE